MRLRPALALVLAGLTFLPGIARAQAWTAYPTVNLLAGYTIAQVFGPYPVDDAYALSGPQLTPSFSLLSTYETPSSLTRGTTQLASVIPFDNSLHFVTKRFNFHGQLNFTTTVDLDPRTDLRSIVNAGITPVNVLAGVVVDASQTPLDVAPDGVSYLINGSVEETVHHLLTRRAAIAASAVLRYNLPYNPEKPRPSSLIFKPSVTGTYSQGDNTFTLTPGTQMIRFGAGYVNQTVSDAHYQFVNTIKGSWSRPIHRTLKGTLNAGINQTFSLGTGSGSSLSGMGGLSLVADVNVAKLSLSYTHDTAVNGLTAQINVSDLLTLQVTAPVGLTARLASFGITYTHSEPIAGDGTLTGNIMDNLTLRSSFPLGATGVTPAVSAAYADIRPAGLNGVFGAGFRTWTGDASAVYTNERLRLLSFNLRGQIAWKQPLDLPSNATFRYTVTAGVGIAWPGQGEHAAAFQMRVAPAYTPTPVLSSEPNAAAGEDAGTFTNPRELTRPGTIDPGPQEPPPPVVTPP
ncbi:MAG: hypothetical protein ABI193_01790 [Minicystis sp.]